MRGAHASTQRTAMNWLRTTGLRITLSVGLALALWIFVTFTENPDTTVVYENVPVRIEGLAPGLIVVNAEGAPRANPPTVDVTVSTDETTAGTIRLSDLKAFVDLSGREPGEHVVPLNVDATRPGLAQAQFVAEPRNLPIRIDQEITRTVPVDVAVLGNVPFSFEQGSPVATVRGQPVTTADVRGPQNRVELVAEAQATADIDRLTANYNSPRPLEALTGDGQVVEGVTIEPATVDVLVPIRSSVGIKRVPVIPQVSGTPAAGFAVVSVTVEPQFVNLTGGSGALDTVQSVQTEAVNIDGASRTISTTVELVRPSEAVLGEGEPRNAVVTVAIAPIARPFTVTVPVPVQAVNVPDDLQISLSPQLVQLTVSGLAGQIAQIGPTQLLGTVDVGNLGPGTYQITPTFNLPEGVTIDGDGPTVTVTLRRPATDTPQPTAAPEEQGPEQATGTPRPTGTPPPATETEEPTATP